MPKKQFEAPEPELKTTFFKESGDYKFLVDSMQNGTYNLSSNPKTFRNVHSARLGKYTLAQVRAKINEAKAETGFNVRKLREEDVEKSDDIETPSVTVTPAPKKPKMVLPDLDHSGSELTINDENVWRPIYVNTSYTDQENIKHHLVCVLLPSGIAQTSSENFSHLVTRNGMELSVIVTWPEVICDPSELHARLLSVDKYAARLSDMFFMSSMTSKSQALRKTLIQLKRNKVENPIKSTTRIPLDFAVQENIHSWDLIGKASTGERIVVYDLISVRQDKFAMREVKKVAFGPSSP